MKFWLNIWYWISKWFRRPTKLEDLKLPKFTIPLVKQVEPLPAPAVRQRIPQNPKRAWNVRKRERSDFGYSTRTRKGVK